MTEAKKHEIPENEFEHIAQYNIDDTTTNADIFKLVRGIYGSASDADVNLTNIGKLYWYLIETKNDRKGKTNG
jgi:hypothetical protein